MRKLVHACLLLYAVSASATLVTFAWDAGPDYPAGTTYELQSNGVTLTGISGTTASIDVPEGPGLPITGQVRAIPPSECGQCDPSAWATLPPPAYVPGARTPLAPLGLSAGKTVTVGGVMAAPTYQSINATSWTDTTSSTKTTSSHSPANGNILALLGGLESTAQTLSSLSTSGPAATQRQIDNTTDYSPLAIYTATATGSSITETITRSSTGQQYFGIVVIEYSGSDGVGASNKARGTTGNPSVSLTTTQDNSAVCVIVTDWNAVSSGTPAISGYTYMSSQSYNGDGAHYGVYIFRNDDVGAQGSKSITMTGKSGTKWQIAAVEIKGTASASASFVIPPRLIMRLIGGNF